MSDEHAKPEVESAHQRGSKRPRFLHIKEVPWEVWVRARHNAALSDLALKDYVIQLLATSGPLQAGPESPSHQEGA